MNKQNKKTYEDIYFERINYLQERISSLTENNYFFEVILWFSNIIEAEITILLSLYEKNIKIISISYTNVLKDYTPRNSEDIRKEGKTLGNLKKELNRYLKNKEILDLIEKFIFVRNKIFHKFFETEEDPLLIENSIKNNINDWWKLVYILSEKINELLKQYCNDFSKELKY